MVTMTKTCRLCKKELPDLKVPEEGDTIPGYGGATTIVTEALHETLSRMPVICDDCEAKDVAAQKAIEDQAKRDRYLSRVRESGLPTELIGKRFADLDEHEDQRFALATAKAWGEGEIKGLAMSGTVGAGKTLLAACAANQALLRGKLDWISVPRLMIQAKAGFKNPARDSVTALLLNHNALVLDDIDKAKPTDFALEMLFEAIDERINAGAQLIVTTNLRAAELLDLIGEPILSRITGYCKGHRIEGDDRRNA